MNIIGMTKSQLLELDPKSVHRSLTADEVLYIATTLGAFWQYDYDAAKQGRVGMHALLKSGLHSDGFFVSKIILEPVNIRRLIAYQVVTRLFEKSMARFDYVVGVPDGATKLGEMIGEILEVPMARMDKVDGRISFATEIMEGAMLLVAEDFCTRGTGFKEGILSVKRRCPYTKFVPYDPVIINRGGLKTISIDGVGDFEILPVVEHRIQDWDPDDHCPLCEMGSEVIKPKVTDENWRLITTSQLQ